MKTESIELPQPFLDCLQSWGALRAELMPTAPDAVAYIDEKLASAAWAWEPKVKPIAPAKFDRTGESLRSPVFSSEQHPWPELDGSPMLPVLQLNLAQASQKAGIALGDGLLQMFVVGADRKLSHF